MLLINKRGADIRHTLHGSPQTTTIYGNSAPITGAAHIIVVALSYAVVIVKLIEQYVFALFAECICKNKQKYSYYQII